MLKSSNGHGAVIALVVSCVLAFGGGQAIAAVKSTADGAGLSKKLRYDADALANPVETQKLYRRLKMAARQVCRRSGEDVFSPAANSCEIAAVAAAVADVNHASLTALHEAHRGRARETLNAWLTSPTPCAQCA